MYRVRPIDTMKKVLRRRMAQARAEWEIASRRLDAILRTGLSKSMPGAARAVRDREAALERYRKAFDALNRYTMSSRTQER